MQEVSLVAPARPARKKGCNFGCLLALVLVVPYLLDGFLNRDPNIYVDEHYRLVAISPSQPKSLIYDRPQPRGKRIEDIEEVTDVKLAQRVIIGKANHPTDEAVQLRRYFIVDRSTDEQFFFDSESSRDRALKRFGTEMNHLKPANTSWGWIRGNWLFPYNLIYYGLVISALGITGYRRLWRRWEARQSHKNETSQ